VRAFARTDACPDIFTAALALTGSPPESAILVGDSPYDIIAARRGGIGSPAALVLGMNRAMFPFRP
jgi:FMN phosphatase YigB (HAD superfamily)